jgi:hypothetical protein
MALKICKECGNQISTSADQCPHCGKKNRSGCGIFLLIFFFIIIIAGVFSNEGKKPISSEQQEKDREFNWIETGKDSVKFKLKDAQSAQFRNVFFHRSKNNIPTTCGEVNSKNGFGGYIGFQRFISIGRPEGTYLEQEIKDFENAWEHFCK